MSMAEALQVRQKIKEPKNLSPRIAWLRDYYFQGAKRAWNNEFTAWTTGTEWDVVFDEMTYYIVPETYPFLQTFGSSFKQAARPVTLHPEFWTWSLPERKAWFVKEVMVNYVPQEILPGDLIAGEPLQSADIQVLDEEGGEGTERARVREERGAILHEVVPRPRLRQLRSHVRSSHPRV